MERNEKTEAMLLRTREFSLAILKFCNEIPQTTITSLLISQLVRSGTSAGANYRATRRAKSRADFINKFKIVEEELDECLFFLECINFVYPEKLAEVERLKNEAEELLKITVASINSLKG